MLAAAPVLAPTAAQTPVQSGSKGVCALSRHANSQQPWVVGCCCGRNEWLTAGAVVPLTFPLVAGLALTKQLHAAQACSQPAVYTSTMYTQACISPTWLLLLIHLHGHRLRMFVCHQHCWLCQKLDAAGLAWLANRFICAVFVAGVSGAKGECPAAGLRPIKQRCSSSSPSGEC